MMVQEETTEYGNQFDTLPVPISYIKIVVTIIVLNPHTILNKFFIIN